MSKFNITVEFDWLTNEYDLESEVKDQIVSSIANQIQEKIFSQVENKCNDRLNEMLSNAEKGISDKLNAIIAEFFETPRNVTDQYGDIIKKNVTVKDMLKTACDNFLTQSLDQNGNPCDKSSYNKKYNTRVDYIVAKSINHDMEWAIKRAVDEVTDNLKSKISNEIKTQMGDKLGKLLDIDKLL